MTIVLGSKVRDKITGFEGIATARVQHITGCDTYWVTPTNPVHFAKDKTARDSEQSFDVLRLEVLKDKPIAIERVSEHGTISAG